MRAPRPRLRSGVRLRGTRSGAQWLALTALVALVALHPFWGARPMLAQVPSANEYAVKAAFLFHFAQFVEWPDGAFSKPDSPLVYCTIGEDPFQGALEESFKGKTISSHSLQVRHFKKSDEAQGCHVAFMGRTASKHFQDELASFQGKPVLTVGETEQFVRDSGIIGFCLEENKIRFDINVEAAEKSRLKISARLLTLAKAVIGKPKRD